MKDFHHSERVLGLIIFAIILSCKADMQNVGIQEYTEQFSPLFHVSPQKNWMGVPCGFVYFEGLYHFFYEHNPDQPINGNLHWGHAVSRDLVNWENLPDAISPDSYGHIFSGSVVVDLKNTSGLGTRENPPMIAYYSQVDPKSIEDNKSKAGMQSIAYSIDRGSQP